MPRPAKRARTTETAKPSKSRAPAPRVGIVVQAGATDEDVANGTAYKIYPSLEEAQHECWFGMTHVQRKQALKVAASTALKSYVVKAPADMLASAENYPKELQHHFVQAKNKILAQYVLQASATSQFSSPVTYRVKYKGRVQGITDDEEDVLVDYVYDDQDLCIEAVWNSLGLGGRSAVVQGSRPLRLYIAALEAAGGSPRASPFTLPYNKEKIVQVGGGWETDKDLNEAYAAIVRTSLTSSGLVQRYHIYASSPTAKSASPAKDADGDVEMTKAD